MTAWIEQITSGCIRGARGQGGAVRGGTRTRRVPTDGAGPGDDTDVPLVAHGGPGPADRNRDFAGRSPRTGATAGVSAGSRGDGRDSGRAAAQFARHSGYRDGVESARDEPPGIRSLAQYPRRNATSSGSERSRSEDVGIDAGKRQPSTGASARAGQGRWHTHPSFLACARSETATADRNTPIIIQSSIR